MYLIYITLLKLNVGVYKILYAFREKFMVVHFFILEVNGGK